MHRKRYRRNRTACVVWVWQARDNAGATPHACTINFLFGAQYLLLSYPGMPTVDMEGFHRKSSSARFGSWLLAPQQQPGTPTGGQLEATGGQPARLAGPRPSCSAARGGTTRRLAHVVPAQTGPRRPPHPHHGAGRRDATVKLGPS